MSIPATFQLDLNEAEQVNIAITDLSGRMISEVLNEFMSAGNHTIKIQTPGFATGIYFLLVRTGNENKMIRLSVTE